MNQIHLITSSLISALLSFLLLSNYCKPTGLKTFYFTLNYQSLPCTVKSILKYFWEEFGQDERKRESGILIAVVLPLYLFPVKSFPPLCRDPINVLIDCLIRLTEEITLWQFKKWSTVWVIRKKSTSKKQKHRLEKRQPKDLTITSNYNQSRQ